MAVTTSLVFDIQPIVGVQRYDGGLQLTFHDGSVVSLDANHPHFDMLRVLIESASRWRRPVGALWDASGKLIDLNEAHDVTVRYIREQEDTPDRLKVALWGFSPMCYLAKDHPEFVRLRTLLATAAGSATRLWVANHSQMVKEEPTTDDGAFEIWWKIMDARTVASVAKEGGEAVAAANQNRQESKHVGGNNAELQHQVP